MNMNDVVIQTLLKYNEIFDALQKVFTLHNYSCQEQKQILSQQLNGYHQSDCIYISLNQYEEVNPFAEQMAKYDSQHKQSMSDLRTEMEVYAIQVAENTTHKAIQQAMILENEKMVELNIQFQEHKQLVEDLYVNKSAQRQLKIHMEERFAKINDQQDYIQSRYALKTYAEQNILELRNNIQNLSQTVNYLREDTKLLHKLNSDVRNTIQSHQNTITQLNTNQEDVIDEMKSFMNHIETMKNIVQTQEDDNKQAISKFKALSQLFQELEVNNSKTVKFEIHSAIRIVDDQIANLFNQHQSLQNQLQLCKENISIQQQHQNDYKKQCDQQFEYFTCEQQYNQKSFKALAKNIEMFKQTYIQQNKNDAATQIQVVVQQQQKLKQYCKGVFKHIGGVIEVIQDFCESTQIQSMNQEKDLTNLLLLFDRRMLELQHQMREPTQIVKLTTPRISQSLDQSFRIHSQKSKKQQGLNYTISFDQK